jgi:hypothetical protein
MMDAGYLSALAGLAGAVIGGLTSFGTTWMTQTTQMRERAVEGSRKKREQLYVDFTQEASRLFADALSHEEGEIASFAKLEAILAHIRMVSPSATVDAAEQVVAAIVDAYVRPNRSLIEMREFAESGGLSPLHGFANLCRQELASYHSTRRKLLSSMA